MKKGIVILLLSLKVIMIDAQTTLLHTYTNSDITNYSYLFVARLEVSGTKYVCVNMDNGIMKLYNLNHTIYKTISLNVVTPESNLVYYISEHLFDLDDGIEYLFLSGNLPAFIKIMDEDGSVLWSESECNPPCQVAGDIFPGGTTPIVNTDSGTILITHIQNGNGEIGKAKVYSLPGTLSNEMAQANGELMKNSGQFSNLYPNPGNGAVTLQYQLPQGEQEGEIILYNTQGAEVKRYKVDGTFKDVIIDNTQLPAGTYFYQLQTGKGVVGTKKMIVVK